MHADHFRQYLYNNYLDLTMALPSGAYFASQFIRRREEWLKILETYFWPQDRKLKKGFYRERIIGFWGAVIRSQNGPTKRANILILDTGVEKNIDGLAHWQSGCFWLRWLAVQIQTYKPPCSILGIWGSQCDQIGQFIRLWASF